MLVHLVSPDEVAAVIVEPIQGEGGYVVPPIEFHQRLRELTKRHGILLIADEVQSGMGRTGRMFACEHFGIDADIVTVAKGIASGLPLGVTERARRAHDVAARRARVDVRWQSGQLCRVAGDDRLVEERPDPKRRGRRRLSDRSAARLDGQTPLIGDVRGKGLMVGVELVRDRTTKERATAERDRVVQEMFQRGVLILGAGRNAIRFAPPLVLSRDQVDAIVTVFDEVLGVVGRDQRDGPLRPCPAARSRDGELPGRAGHLPIMLAEVLACLRPSSGDTALDCTFGGGAHAEAILQHIPRPAG